MAELIKYDQQVKQEHQNYIDSLSDDQLQELNTVEKMKIVSPSGYVFYLSVDDDGSLATTKK